MHLDNNFKKLIEINLRTSQIQMKRIKPFLEKINVLSDKHFPVKRIKFKGKDLESS